MKNEFSKKKGLADPTEATIVVRILTRDLRIYDRLIVGLVLWYFFTSRDSVFLFVFFAIMNIFRQFEDRNVVLEVAGSSPLVRHYFSSTNVSLFRYTSIHVKTHNHNDWSMTNQIEFTDLRQDSYL